MVNILSVSGKPILTQSGMLKIAGEFNFVTNVLVGKATKTVTATFSATTINGDVLVIRTNGNTYQQSGSGSLMYIPLTIGETVSVAPASGNWNNCTMLRIEYLEIDLLKESVKFTTIKEYWFIRLTVNNANLAYFGNREGNLYIHSSSQYQGNLSDVSNCKGVLNFNGQTQIAGNFTSLSKQLKGFEFYSPYIGGDLAYFSDMSLTIIRLVGVNAYGSIANLANSVVVGLESMPNITGDVSELTYTLSLTTALTIRACAALTLSTTTLAGTPRTINFFLQPLFIGEYSDFYNSNSVYCIGTGIATYTTVPNNVGFKALTIIWYNNGEPVITQQNLIKLIADKRTYAVANNQLNGTINIGGGNAAITDTQALADIATLTGMGWTITYNS